jgi:ribonuclease P protein component
MRAGSDFAATVRRGRRAGSPRVVVHLAQSPSATPARVGFVVSRAVGGSVVRHRVVRRLRAALRPQLGALPAGALVVVRAQPAAAAASFDDLVRDVERLLVRAGLPATDTSTGGAR